MAAAATHPRDVSAALLSRTGSEYMPEQGQLVAVEGTDLRLTPDFDEQHPAIDGYAYAIYRFNLQGVDSTNTLSISWPTPPENTADLWLGLSRWAKGCWEWHSTPAGSTLALGPTARPDYSEPATGDLYVVVLLTGTTEAVLQQLSLNGYSTPSAQLIADPTSGAPPLLVSFDASGSSSPAGSIVKYEWDWDGTGNGPWDEDTGSTPTTSHEYAAGNYTAWVKVTDEIGGEATASVSISAADQATWPMFGYDAQHTGRSPFVGAQTNNVKWTFTTEGEVRSSPAIGADGTVYFSSFDGKLYAVNPDGSLQWSQELGESEWIVFLSSPAIGLDGKIYVNVQAYLGTPEYNVLHAISPDGSLNWTYEGGGGETGIKPESPTIGADGTVYVKGSIEPGQSAVHAINPDGSLKWTFSKDGIGGAYRYPTVGLDGTVYQAFIENAVAINPDGSLKWESGVGSTRSQSVGADGTVYIAANGTPVLHAFNPDGSQKWSYPLPSKLRSCAGIGADGTVYALAGMVYAITADGSLKWTYDTAGAGQSSPAIGADGTLYLGGTPLVYAINANGSLKWSYTTGAQVRSSPAIGADGTVYVGSDDGKLYAFGP